MIIASRSIHVSAVGRVVGGTRRSWQHPRLWTCSAASGRMPTVLGCHSIVATSLRGHRQLPRFVPEIYKGQLGAVTHFSSFFGGGGGRRPGGNRLAQGVGLLGAASVLFGKTKYVLAALKLTKLASLGSMIFTVGAYTMVFGFPYAVGMVSLILVHETGHALAMLHRGIPFSPMVFLPFMGAVIATKERPRDAWEDAFIALGGPIMGSAGAGLVAVAAHSTNSQLLFALADFGFMVNLFNLLPIGSMDGGRVVGALSPNAGLAGLGLGGYLAYTGAIVNPIFYLVLLGGGYEAYQRYANPHHLPPNFYRITRTQRFAISGAYFGLIVALCAAMDANQRYRKDPEQIVRERQSERFYDMT